MVETSMSMGPGRRWACIDAQVQLTWPSVGVLAPWSDLKAKGQGRKKVWQGDGHEIQR